ncbi:MAG: glycogen synthase GlgA [Polyangiaceae bacterium]|nr:glycogen synthase GlgA [Polyangiaceae bacterium]
MKILYATSECFPYAKAGGLGDVAGALPVALAERGHDVRVVMPRYATTKKFDATPLAGSLGIPFGPMTAWARILRANLGEDRGVQAPVYFIEHDRLYDRGGIYNDSHGDFGDNLERFAMLSRGAIELCRYLGFEPDVIHVHDWPTCLLPVYLDTVEAWTPIARAATVLTIHNMGYQGWFPRADFPKSGMPWDSGAVSSLEMHGQLNLLKAGIMHSTMVSTVSPRYAAEIQTKDGGEGLDGLLRARGNDVVGVLNGIDESTWNPEVDRHIAANYSAHDLGGKAECKAALQRELGLEQNPHVPLLGVVSRLVGQKGIDVVADALGRLLELGTQIVILGSGDSHLESQFQALSHQSRSFRAWIGMNEGLAHRIEAGSDLFLMPSRYEPCGLNQMYSQRYGTLPVVRAVGGLDDTVENGETGFKFDDLTADALVATVAWAVEIYRHDPHRFHSMRVRSMQKQMGWSTAAKQYDALYRLAIRRRRG